MGSGNLGIGTANPSAPLHVRGQIYGGYRINRPFLQIESFDTTTGWSKISGPSGGSPTVNTLTQYTTDYTEGTGALLIDEVKGYSTSFAKFEKTVSLNLTDYTGFTMWFKCDKGENSGGKSCYTIGNIYLYFSDGTNTVGLDMKTLIPNPSPGIADPADKEANMTWWYPVTWTKAQMIHFKQISTSSSEPMVGWSTTINWGAITTIGMKINTQEGNIADMYLDNLIAEKDHPEGYVFFKFDDGALNHYTIAFPTLNALGVRGVLSVPAGLIDTSGKITSTQAKTMHDAGWEFIAHTYQHASAFGTLADSEIQYEMLKPIRTYQYLGITRGTKFFDLVGGGNDKYGETAMKYMQRYYVGTFGGGTTDGPTMWNYRNPYYQRANCLWNVVTTSAAAITQMQQCVDLVDIYGGLAVMLFHTVDNTTSTDLQISKADLQTLVNYAKGKSNTHIVTPEWYYNNKITDSSFNPIGRDTDKIITTYTATSTLKNWDGGANSLVIVDTTSNAVGLTLPACNADTRGLSYSFKLDKGGANNGTIARSGSDTIDEAAADVTLSTDKELKKLVCNGNTNWWVE